MVTFAVDLASYVPSGFDAYARVFHPIGRDDERWSDVAVRNGRVAHPEMQAHTIRLAAPHADDACEGSLPSDAAAVLVEHLARATSDAGACWFCVWEGWGSLDQQGVTERVRLPARDYLLCTGSIDAAEESFTRTYHQSAAIWWPQDRAWVVATEIDFGWTYVGGSVDVVAGIVADTRIEAMPVGSTHSGSFDADLINR